MHFEILVEGQTELTTLSILMPKIVGPYQEPHTWRIHKHRGIGKLPTEPTLPTDKKDPSLLYNLPKKLRAYGREMGADEMVVVLVDLDDRPDCRAFKAELTQLLAHSIVQPNCLFRMAIEELEAWFLGDPAAIKASYPHANTQKWSAYIQDSQCGTWEVLADIINPALKTLGKRSRILLEEKQKWAKQIAPNMNVEQNGSPSFLCFRDGLRKAINPA